jgi:tyrosine-protein kinase Etk/Wzc
MTEQDTNELQLIRTKAADTQIWAEEAEKTHFLDPVVTLARYRALVLGLPLIVGVLSAAILLMLPPAYTAEVKIVPPQQNQSIAAAAGILGQLGPLASAATNGKDLSLHGPSDLYAVMLHSRTVADALIRRFSLMNAYSARRHVDARRRLDNATQIIISKENVISISVTDRDPKRAAEMANAYVEELLELTHTLAVTEAGHRRLFFEHEVQLASDELATAEQALKKTQETTGIIQLDSQAKAVIESITALHAQVSAREAQIQAMRTYATSENPDLVRAQQELSFMRKELVRMESGQGGTSVSDVSVRKVPETGLEYVRRLREVKYREALLDILTRQYEAARIDEAKDAAIVQVLDKAEPPEIRSWPHRTSSVLTAMLLAFSLAVVLAFVAERFKSVKADPEFAARIQLIRFSLKQK